MHLSVIICTHNPDLGRLRRTLLALCNQVFPVDHWETLLIDNASAPTLQIDSIVDCCPSNTRVIRESRLGLAAARRRGIAEATATTLIFVDDDNVLAPDYLKHVSAIFASHPRLGALGGRSIPEFEATPPPWAIEFLPLLALREGGNAPTIAEGLRESGSERNRYPEQAAPIGAGMALRKSTLAAWANDANSLHVSDRRGEELTSGGDNDIIFSVLSEGWQVGYFPQLHLIHLIPVQRLQPHYLARLNFGIQKSWVQVLRKYGACPWPTISRTSLPLRKIKAWLTCKAWKNEAARIRWSGISGRLTGLAQVNL